ncbi:MAG: branched-chain amino acid aminotransferase [Deltaproteobacteria bacterium]|nr:branched-chain amino acid aminotransferase [Deltaproteobacteria bacterium]MBW1919698.1 branched-chain amino acid aminotransferase [Deltaproteobacteria bacterium]MBW1934416.1 branched-chain amino acid aminotransferase [Deltaproteobacteria bacterium]MBW1979099.1 branched-chain amino acid aminotransferase [Deltaproteobacteria bacterium]MBW2044997.1 branched-chain amino acid aminotransferase [Deltaproteobacteria bacterium]
MEIKIERARAEQLKPKPADESRLGFGDIFTDHIFLMDYEKGKGWFSPRIVPYTNLSIDPAAMVLHYGQEVFEGLKAYGGKDGAIYLFRARENFKRLNRSARRLCIPEIDAELAMDGLRQLIVIDREWVPRTPGTSLYIRPNIIATEPHLGVRPSNTYLFYIIIGPVGAYYKEGLNPVKIYVEDKYIRAAPGGTGEAKTAGNYAASLLAAEEAKEKGFTQVLWLDAVERKYVEEVGTMNMFFVIQDEVITAPLSGSILPGITRDSVIHMVKDWGMKMSERSLAIDEVIDAAQSGALKEAFGTGTAAVISPVGEITYKGKAYVVAGGKMGELSQRLYNEIVAIQYAQKEDPYGWREKIA